MCTVYLCGPINGCTDEECINWRNYIKENISPTLDPMDRDYRGKEGDYVKEIVENDKKDIDKSTIILVNYVKPSVGTSMEVLYAWERSKYIIVVADEGASISPWLRYHCNIILYSFEEAIKEIKEVQKLV